MPLTNVDISTLIPQADPFIMIDHIVQIDENSISTELNIRPDHVLCENNRFQEAGLIEMMAQTAACLTGYRSKESNKEIRTGYIGMVKNLEIYRLPSCHSNIIATIIEKKQVLNIVIINGKIMQDDDLIAQAEYRIYLQA